MDAHMYQNTMATDFEQDRIQGDYCGPQFGLNGVPMVQIWAMKGKQAITKSQPFINLQNKMIVEDRMLMNEALKMNSNSHRGKGFRPSSTSMAKKRGSKSAANFRRYLNQNTKNTAEQPYQVNQATCIGCDDPQIGDKSPYTSNSCMLSEWYTLGNKWNNEQIVMQNTNEINVIKSARNSQSQQSSTTTFPDQKGMTASMHTLKLNKVDTSAITVLRKKATESSSTFRQLAQQQQDQSPFFLAQHPSYVENGQDNNLVVTTQPSEQQLQCVVVETQQDENGAPVISVDVDMNRSSRADRADMAPVPQLDSLPIFPNKQSSRMHSRRPSNNIKPIDLGDPRAQTPLDELQQLQQNKELVVKNLQFGQSQSSTNMQAQKRQRLCKGKSLKTIPVREPIKPEPCQMQQFLHRHVSCDVSSQNKKQNETISYDSRPLAKQKSSNTISGNSVSQNTQELLLKKQTIDSMDSAALDDAHLRVPDVIIVNQSAQNGQSTRRSVISKQSQVDVTYANAGHNRNDSDLLSNIQQAQIMNPDYPARDSNVASEKTSISMDQLNMQQFDVQSMKQIQFISETSSPLKTNSPLRSQPEIMKNNTTFTILPFDMIDKGHASALLHQSNLVLRRGESLEIEVTNKGCDTGDLGELEPESAIRKIYALTGTGIVSQHAHHLRAQTAAEVNSQYFQQNQYNTQPQANFNYDIEVEPHSSSRLQTSGGMKQMKQSSQNQSSHNKQEFELQGRNIKTILTKNQKPAQSQNKHDMNLLVRKQIKRRKNLHSQQICHRPSSVDTRLMSQSQNYNSLQKMQQYTSNGHAAVRHNSTMKLNTSSSRDLIQDLHTESATPHEPRGISLGKKSNFGAHNIKIVHGANLPRSLSQNQYGASFNPNGVQNLFEGYSNVKPLPDAIKEQPLYATHRYTSMGEIATTQQMRRIPTCESVEHLQKSSSRGFCRINNRNSTPDCQDMLRYSCSASRRQLKKGKAGIGKSEYNVHQSNGIIIL